MFYLGEYGWRPLIAIGALPLLLVPVFIKYLPESISFLLSQNRKPEALQLADKIGIDQNSIENYQISKEEKVNIFSLLKELFSAKHLRATTLFWSSQIATVLGVYGLSTWLPQIMKTNGYGISSSISFLAIFMLSAGLGSVFIGRLTDRLNTRKTIVMFYLIGAVAIFYLSFNYHIALTYVLVALAGMGITGSVWFRLVILHITIQLRSVLVQLVGQLESVVLELLCTDHRRLSSGEWNEYQC